MILRFRDFLPLSNKDVPDWVKRSYDVCMKDSEKASLKVEIDATHSGRITNGRVYPGKKMRSGMSSWLSKEDGGTSGYSKPVLTHHNDTSDPIGRIIGAKYISLKRGEDFDNDYMDPDQKGPGSGFIRLIAAIGDDSAIQKILDGRYQTVSTGQSSPSMRCSICDKEMIPPFMRFLMGMDEDEDACNHIPGRKYKVKEDKRSYQKLCFGITGDLDYNEVSFVNRPADQYAKVVEGSFSKIEDAQEIWSNIEDYEISSLEGDRAMMHDFRIYDALGKEIRADEPVVQMIVDKEDKEIYDTDKHTDGHSHKYTHGDKYTTTAKKHKHEVDVKTLTVLDAEGHTHIMLRDDPMAVNNSADVYIEKMLNGEPLDETEQDEFYELMTSEMDAKLSTKQRKSLKSSTFCGPGRSFPVPDCAHVTAARRLIGRYKGSGNKASILSCVNSKAKKLGCGGKKDEVQNATDMLILSGVEYDNINFDNYNEDTLLYLSDGFTEIANNIHSDGCECPSSGPDEGDVKDENASQRNSATGSDRGEKKIPESPDSSSTNVFIHKNREVIKMTDQSKGDQHEMSLSVEDLEQLTKTVAETNTRLTTEIGEVKSENDKLKTTIQERDETIAEMQQRLDDQAVQNAKILADALVASNVILKRKSVDGVVDRESFDAMVVKFAERSPDSLRDSLADSVIELVEHLKLGCETSDDETRNVLRNEKAETFQPLKDDGNDEYDSFNQVLAQHNLKGDK